MCRLTNRYSRPQLRQQQPTKLRTLNYVDSCLMHWIVRWEQNIALQLLTKEERQKGLFVEFLVDGLLRGNSQARAEYYNKIFQVAGIKPNEIRAKKT